MEPYTDTNLNIQRGSTVHSIEHWGRVAMVVGLDKASTTRAANVPTLLDYFISNPGKMVSST